MEANATPVDLNGHARKDNAQRRKDRRRVGKVEHNERKLPARGRKVPLESDRLPPVAIQDPLNARPPHQAESQANRGRESADRDKRTANRVQDVCILTKQP